ncbi:MAG: hypothetical protein CVV56_05860 [Tenericutes bacterium HGW-Tenericutes-1]|nr:MAG: hypothetical protein CVV56_05860 [Tenericutes bacterium HGW-Tenericutes-1]
MTDTAILIITIVSIVIAIGLLYLLTTLRNPEKRNKYGVLIAIAALVFIIGGITFSLSTKDSPVSWPQIIMVDSLILVGYLAVMALVIKLSKRDDATKKISNRMITSLVTLFAIIVGISYALFTKETPTPFLSVVLIDVIIALLYLVIMAVAIKCDKRANTPKTLSTRKVAFLGILIGLASALMLLGFPIMPLAPYLKVELSGLIIFMALLWFDWKTAAVVSLYTNFIHVFLPGSAPVIIFLDEGVNFIATMVFIMPMAIFLNRAKLSVTKKISPIFIISVIGVIFTAVVMTLYNAFINLPLVYGWPMPFWTVVEIFGVFNLIKWGFVAIVINLTWKRLYSLRNFGEEEPEALD